MSITVTVEELQKYEHEMNDWFLKRIVAAEEARIPEMDGSQRKLMWRVHFEDWLQQNPQPKLIPTV